MASPITFTNDTSLDAASEEAVYTLALLRGFPFANALVKQFEEILIRCDAVGAEQRNQARAMIRCQADIASADARLDSLIDKVDLAVSAFTEKNRQHPFYKLVFGDWRVSELKRPSLGAELEAIRGWPKILVESGDATMQALAPQLNEAIGKADLAVGGLAEAQNANRSFRLTGSRKKFIDDFNALRASSFGFLKEYLHSHSEQNLPADFASQFFRKGRRSGPVTVEDLDAEIAAVEKDLAALRDQRSVVFAKVEADAKVKAESDLKVKERLIAMAKSAADEAVKRLQTLQSKI